MLRTSLKVVGVIILPAAVLLTGCSKSATPSGAVKPATVNENLADKATVIESAQKEVNEKAGDDAKIAAILAKLSPEDRTLAEKQKVCPVSGEQLGLMGPPVKLDVKGQPVFICCNGCREKILASPDEYLAKLNK